MELTDNDRSGEGEEIKRKWFQNYFLIKCFLALCVSKSSCVRVRVCVCVHVRGCIDVYRERQTDRWIEIEIRTSSKLSVSVYLTMCIKGVCESV